MGLIVRVGESHSALMQQDIDTWVDDETGHLSTDSRRRLEAKIEDLQLMREMQEFDFDD